MLDTSKELISPAHIQISTMTPSKGIDRTKAVTEQSLENSFLEI